MKIGVIGPETTASVIRRVVKRDFPNVELVCRCTEFYEESRDLTAALQKSNAVDAILFTGPTNYSQVRKELTPSIPWSYLPHSRAAALQAFLEAMALCHSDLTAISTDFYNPEFLRDTLESAGIHCETILQFKLDVEDPQLEKHIRDFHRNCYQRGLVTACFTNLEHVMPPLRKEGIPCVRIHPSEEGVQEQIYHLMRMHLSSQKNRGKFAVIDIFFDYAFDKEQDLTLREWEKMQYQNKLREEIFSIAQWMEAAVFNDGMNRFFILTTQDIAMNSFLKGYAYQRLLQIGHQSPAYQLWMGIGIGDTSLTAQSRAAAALSQSIADHSGNSYLVENEIQTISATERERAEQSRHSTAHFARKIQVSVDTLKKVEEILRQNGDIVTSNELSQKLGLSLRSVNRMLIRLEEEGCASIVGKQANGKGRPARVMKIVLPDSILSPDMSGERT